MSRFETPGLTPIPSNASTLGPSPTDTDDSKVLMRAEQVAARLYYHPSPETPHTAEIRNSLQYLGGLGRHVECDATPANGDTPLRRGGGATKENSGVVQSSMSSSFSRQPRALFMSADSTTNRSAAEHEGMNQQNCATDGGRIFDRDLGVQQTSQEGIREILGLLSVIGSGWRRLCQVRFSEL
jgi:hypothetical protein